jgi:hypothetical protein
MIVNTELEGIQKESVVTHCQVRLGRILENNIGKRPLGKSSKRWVNSVEIDNREIFKMRK